jgi:hypothetical protein
MRPRGEEFFQHRLVFDRASAHALAQPHSEERLQALLQESPAVATKTRAIKPSELSRVIVDTTVRSKNVTCGRPPDVRKGTRCAARYSPHGANGCVTAREFKTKDVARATNPRTAERPTRISAISLIRLREGLDQASLKGNAKNPTSLASALSRALALLSA